MFINLSEETQKDIKFICSEFVELHKNDGVYDKEIESCDLFNKKMAMAIRRLENSLRICGFCRKKYIKGDGLKTYCSNSCLGKYHARKNKQPIKKEKKCEHCGEIFKYVRNSKMFCDIKCYNESLKFN